MMKDKLYKTNHKTMYYVARKALLALVFFMGLGAAVAVPTTINVLMTEPTQLLAETTSENQNTDQESSQEELISYINTSQQN